MICAIGPLGNLAMRHRQFVAAIPLAFSFIAWAHGAEPAKAVVGQARVSWRHLPGVDGKQHALADLEDRELVVVAITCNHCPIAIEYYDRMKDFARRHCGPEGQVGLVAISLSNLETDRLARMKEMAQRQAFNFSYLHDETQQIGRALGATTTPQFFVLDRDRVLVYRGAWDDNINVAKVTQRYVDDAVEALLAGKTPPVQETRAKGCIIRYEP